jgi:polar amino acid transport system substrate-binding protein
MFNKFKLIICSLVLVSSSLYADKLDEIKERGTMNAGVKYDFKPFGFINKSGSIVGFDIDLIKYIAKKMNVNVKFQQVTSKTRIPMLVSGEIDIVAASMTHKYSRDESIDFSISYFFDGQAMLVRSDEKQTSFRGFENRKVGAIQGATSGKNFKKIQPKAKVVYFQEYPQAVLALKKGKIDAITTDLVWCETQAKDSRKKLKVLNETISYEPYAVGLSENESNFRDTINFAIQEAVRDGYYEKLYLKWFGKKPTKIPEVWPK